MHAGGRPKKAPGSDWDTCSLREMYLRACRALTAKPNSKLLKMLPATQDVKTLDITEFDFGANYLGEAGMRAFLEPLRRAPSLTILNLSDNGLTDAAVMALSRVLQDHPAIAQLDLSSNAALTKRCVVGLRRIAENPSVREIHLRGVMGIPRSDCNLLGDMLKKNEEMAAVERARLMAEREEVLLRKAVAHFALTAAPPKSMDRVSGLRAAFKDRPLHHPARNCDGWAIVNVWISCGSDCSAEYNRICGNVIPALNRRLQSSKVHLVAYSADEGVPLPAALNALESYCHIYIGLYADRAGRFVGTTEVSPDVLRGNQGASANPLLFQRLMFACGFLRWWDRVWGHERKSKAGFHYIRSPKAAESAPVSLSHLFKEDNQVAADLLTSLKEDIKSTVPATLLFDNYPAIFGGIDCDGKLILDQLAELEGLMLLDIFHAVGMMYNLELTDDSGVAPVSSSEAPQTCLARQRITIPDWGKLWRQVWSKETTRYIVEDEPRREILRKLEQTVRGPADASRIHIVVGDETGCGVTTTLGQLYHNLTDGREIAVAAYFDTAVMTGSPGCDEARGVLLMLWTQLRRLFPSIAFEDRYRQTAMEVDSQRVRFHFWNQLDMLARRVVLIVDSIDRLKGGEWLPDTGDIPPHVFIVAGSVRPLSEGPPSDNPMGPALAARVNRLTGPDAVTYVLPCFADTAAATYWNQLQHKADTQDLTPIRGLNATKRPLYSSLLMSIVERRREFAQAAASLRMESHYDARREEVDGPILGVDELLSRVPDSIERAVEWLMEHGAVGNPGCHRDRFRMLRYRALTLLACARNGLTALELRELLIRPFNYTNGVRPPASPMTPLVLSARVSSVNFQNDLDKDGSPRRGLRMVTAATRLKQGNRRKTVSATVPSSPSTYPGSPLLEMHPEIGPADAFHVVTALPIFSGTVYGAVHFVEQEATCRMKGSEELTEEDKIATEYLTNRRKRWCHWGRLKPAGGAARMLDAGTFVTLLCDIEPLLVQQRGCLSTTTQSGSNQVDEDPSEVVYSLRPGLVREVCEARLLGSPMERCRYHGELGVYYMGKKYMQDGLLSRRGLRECLYHLSLSQLFDEAMASCVTLHHTRDVCSEALTYEYHADLALLLHEIQNTAQASAAVGRTLWRHRLDAYAIKVQQQIRFLRQFNSTLTTLPNSIFQHALDQVSGNYLQREAAALHSHSPVPHFITLKGIDAPVAEDGLPARRRCNLCAINVEGSWVAVADCDGEVFVYNVQEGVRLELKGYHPQGQSLSRLLLSPKGRWAYTTSGRGSALWDVEAGGIRMAALGGEDGEDRGEAPAHVVALADGLLALGAVDGSLRVWSLFVGVGLGTQPARAAGGFPQPQVPVAARRAEASAASVAISPDGSFVVVTSENGRSAVWVTTVLMGQKDEDKGWEASLFQGPTKLESQCLHPGHQGQQAIATTFANTELVATMFTGAVCVWKVQDGATLLELRPPGIADSPQLDHWCMSDGVVAFACNKASGSGQSRSVVVHCDVLTTIAARPLRDRRSPFDMHSRHAILHGEDHFRLSTRVSAMAGNGQYLSLVLEDRTVRVFDLRDGSELFSHLWPESITRRGGEDTGPCVDMYGSTVVVGVGGGPHVVTFHPGNIMGPPKKLLHPEC